jgi:hypothetical protein
VIVALMVMTGPTLPTALSLKVGLRWSDLVTMTYRDKGDDFEMTFRDRWDWSVESIDPQGNVFLKRKQVNLATTMGGAKLPGGDVRTLSLTLTKRGVLKQIQLGEVDPNVEFRLARALTAVLPPEPGTKSWQYEYPAAPEGKIPALRMDLTPGPAVKDHPSIKVSMQETGGRLKISGGGAAVLDENGMIYSLDLKLKNAVVPGSEGQPCELTVSLKRQEKRSSGGKD